MAKMKIKLLDENNRTVARTIIINGKWLGVDYEENWYDSFEAAFKLAHMDSLLEDAKKSAVQEDLSKRKQRQQEAPLANGAGATPDDPTLDDLVKADAKELLENF